MLLEWVLKVFRFYARFPLVFLFNEKIFILTYLLIYPSFFYFQLIYDFPFEYFEYYEGFHFSYAQAYFMIKQKNYTFFLIIYGWNFRTWSSSIYLYQTIKHLRIFILNILPFWQLFFSIIYKLILFNFLV